MGLNYDQPTTDTVIHLELTRLLEEMGYNVEKEVSFPPYSVDCYVSDLHVAFEADGPTHSRDSKPDTKRDAVLLATYALPVIRVTQAALIGTEVHKFKMLARSILRSSWLASASQRQQYSGE